MDTEHTSLLNAIPQRRRLPPLLIASAVAVFVFAGVALQLHHSPQAQQESLVEKTGLTPIVATIAMRGGRHGKYCADESCWWYGCTSKVKCNRNHVGSWETFVVAVRPSLCMDFTEHGGVYLAGYAPGASATGWPDLFTAQEWCCARTNCGGITLQGSEKKCADEGGTCQCKGQVKYGANGKWSKHKASSSSLRCTNGVFGDPYPGIRKACYCGSGVYTARAVGRLVPDSLSKPTFVLSTTKRNYADSAKYCKSIGMTIASIHSKAENTAVKKLLKAVSYLGATEIKNGGNTAKNWKWDDGSKWDFLASNDGLKSGGESRVAFSTGNPQWHDWGTGKHKLGVVCRKNSGLRTWVRVSDRSTRRGHDTDATPVNLRPFDKLMLRGGKRGRWCVDTGSGGVKCNARYNVDSTPEAKFFVERLDCTRQIYALRGGKDHKYCADEGDRIVCNRDRIGSLERFTVKTLSSYSRKGIIWNKYAEDYNRCDQDFNDDGSYG